MLSGSISWKVSLRAAGRRQRRSISVGVNGLARVLALLAASENMPGLDRLSGLMWATDYPHPDHPHTWVDDLTRYAQTLPAGTREKVLGGNVKRIYKLEG